MINKGDHAVTYPYIGHIAAKSAESAKDLAAEAFLSTYYGM